MTGDDHGNNGTEGRWNQFLAQSQPGCSVEDWECVRGTSYIFTYSPLTDAKVAAFEAQGFEVGLHVNTDCADFTEAQLESIYETQMADFASHWPSAPAPTTQRHHCIAWTDWVAAAKVQGRHGIRLNTSYYFWPPEWVLNRPGFFNGSGMAMRFADRDGTLIDVYQAATEMTDESGQEYPYTIDTLLDRALGSAGYYGAYVINAHTDVAQTTESDAVVASAIDHQVPIITSRQMLTWLDGHNNSSFQSISWDDGNEALSFTVNAADGAKGLQALVPISVAGSVVNAVKRDGASVPYSAVSRKGVDYASFDAIDGAYVVTYEDDIESPTVISQSPPNGAQDVGLGSSISVVFSEPMDASTINASTFSVSPASGSPVAATFAYDADSRTALLRPSSALAAQTTYTAKLSAGGAADLAGNRIAEDVLWSFTTQPPLGCPCSLWSASDTPANASAADPNGVELGVKFRSEIGGYVTGIRFYKGTGNTGTHIGRLWAAGGTLLATATFTNETATGWQQVDFDTPVPINTNTQYVASYYAPNGGYAYNQGYFSASGLDNAPLHAYPDGQGGGNGVAHEAKRVEQFEAHLVRTRRCLLGKSNREYPSHSWPHEPTGVYRYGAGGVFPNQSWNASNYWVDAVFSDTAPGPGGDTTPPTVTATVPVNGATNVAVVATVTATFSEPLDQATLTTATFELRDGANTLVNASVSYNPTTKTATLTPSSAMTAETVYSAKLKGGEIKDLAGNALAADYVWSFTTGSTPCTTTPCSLWDAGATPTLLADPDTTAVEIGVKFRSSIGGQITGLRFYKSTQNTGTHVGNLWTSGGTLLATATFSGESASGWQQVNFDTPVSITANTVYVASYHAPVGRYSVDENYFNVAHTNGPLTALANSESSNGVYKYGTSGLPTNSYRASNYWIDVLFKKP
jgi:hypothetical protein